MGIYGNMDDPQLGAEKRALLSILHHMDVEGVSCKFGRIETKDGKLKIIAHIFWPDQNDIKELQISRKMEEVAKQVGKR